MVLNQENQTCMKQEECPKICPINEHWNECGSDCETSCVENPNKMCNMACVPKCQCDKGFVRGENGNCIPKESCPKRCGKNQIFNHCGSDCEATCKTADEDIVCTMQCVAKCECETGFIRDDESGECIPVDKCPNFQKCGENEEFKQCSMECGQQVRIKYLFYFFMTETSFG